VSTAPQQQWCNILPLRHAADSLPLPLLLLAVYSMPMPRPGQVLGLVGTNGIGKSTALKILAGKLKPNLGRFSSPPDWEEILGYFRGSELQVGRGEAGRGGGRGGAGRGTANQGLGEGGTEGEQGRLIDALRGMTPLA
jgi:hypothetical protein